jgi:hypothetical protein
MIDSRKFAFISGYLGIAGGVIALLSGLILLVPISRFDEIPSKFWFSVPGSILMIFVGVNLVRLMRMKR